MPELHFNLGSAFKDQGKVRRGNRGLQQSDLNQA